MKHAGTNPAALVAGRRGILFDLFHTLTDAEDRWANTPTTSEALGVSREAWNEQLLERSRSRLTGEVTDPYTIFSGMAHAIDPTIPEQTIRRVIAARIARFEQALLGIPERNLRVLAELKRRGKRLALVSNADVTEIGAWPRSPAAPHFDATIFSCHVGHAKPDPEIYALAMERLGMQPGECLFVGDGSCDELPGARRAGLATVMMAGVIRHLWPDRVEARMRQADHAVEALSELLG